MNQELPSYSDLVAAEREIEGVDQKILAMPKPILSDTSPFAGWLRGQGHRRDPVGAVARVAVQDPTWPGGADRAVLREYFVTMGARQFVLDALRQAWEEFELAQRRDRTRTKNKAAKQARKRNRGTRRR